MKSILRTVLLSFTLVFALSACTKEVIEPNAAPAPNMAFHGYDDPWCGGVSSYTMVDDLGSPVSLALQPYGELHVANHDDSIRFMLELSPGWFVDKASVFVGNSSDIPMTQNGFINTLLLQLQSDPLQPLNSMTESWGVSARNAQCYDVVYWCEVVQIDFFTGPIQSTRRNLWANQSVFANGFLFDYCYTPCPQISIQDRFQ